MVSSTVCTEAAAVNMALASAEWLWCWCLVTDSKSVYDVIKKQYVASIDKWAGLELQVVLDSLRTYGGCCRWVPHYNSAADAMTKLRSHWRPVLTMSSLTTVQVVPEESWLVWVAVFLRRRSLCLLNYRRLGLECCANKERRLLDSSPCCHAVCRHWRGTLVFVGVRCVVWVVVMGGIGLLLGKLVASGRLVSGTTSQEDVRRCRWWW